MGKVKSYLSFIFFFLIIISSNSSYGYNSYNEDYINDYIENYNAQLSPKYYDNYDECYNKKELYNIEYSEFNRSNCFEYNENFYYFVCQGENSCNLENPEETQTTTSSSDDESLSVSEKKQLDTVVSNLKSKGESYDDLDKYNKLLEIFEENLDTLQKKYSSNTKLSLKVKYLKEKVYELKNEINNTNSISTNSDDSIIQGLYRVTNNTYTKSQVKNNDVCKVEFGSEWTNDLGDSADGKIMLVGNLNVNIWDPSKLNTTNCQIYNSSYKNEIVSCESEYKAACIVDETNKIINNSYRLTQNSYSGNILIEGDICKKEFGNEWKLITENKDGFNSLVENFPEVNIWLTIPDYFSHLDIGNYFYYYKNGGGGSEYYLNKQILDKYNTYGNIRNVPVLKNSKRFACELDDDNNNDSSELTQDLYKGTYKKYSYNEFINSEKDLCKVDFGFSWKTSSGSIDANIMLKSKNDTLTWINDSENKCSYYDGENTQKNCKLELSIACEKDSSFSRNENYLEYLESTTSEGIIDFYNKVEKDVQSKITQNDNYIFFNNNYALTKERYYGNQIYTQRTCEDGDIYCSNGKETSSVCPTGFKIEENNSLYYNHYEQELIGYYLSKNMSDYDFVKYTSGNSSYTTSFWSWYNLDQYYVKKKTLDEIKESANTTSFKTSTIKLTNPYYAWDPYERYEIDDYTRNNTYAFTDQYGSSGIIGIKRPVLCVTTDDSKINISDDNQIYNDVISNKITKTSDYISINNSRNNGWDSFFFSYYVAKIRGLLDTGLTKRASFTKEEIFLPVFQKISNGHYYYIFYKKWSK